MGKKNRRSNNFKEVTTNKSFLYLIAVIAFISIMNYVINLNYNAIILFIAISILSYCYTKNMAIVLGIATISTFVINYLNSIMRFEGFKEGQHEDAPDEKEQEDDEPVKAVKKVDKQAYQNLALNPSIIPNADNIKKQVGKIDKLEKAYDDYDSVIKNNDFKSIPTDTKEIVSKQKDMLKQLKDMTPMLDQAMSTIQNINTTGLHKMLEGVNEMADSFGKN